MLVRRQNIKLTLACVSSAAYVLAPDYASASIGACAVLPNTAFAQVSESGAVRVISSNTASIRVEELLDLHLASAADAVAIQTQGQSAAPFILTNAGNGAEAFLLDGGIKGTDAVIEGFALDRNGDGAFDAAADLFIATGAATPSLAPGASVRLLALVRASAPAKAGTLHISSRSVTGTGTPGSALPGQGDGGCDAVIGGTTASGELDVSLTAAAGADLSQIELIKSQVITAPNGSTAPARGAIVTYSIESRFGGASLVRSARLADVIPRGSIYVPGSLRLDGAELTDGADGDAGSFDGAGVQVVLGDVISPATRRVEFKVKVQ